MLLDALILALLFSRSRSVHNNLHMCSLVICVLGAEPASVPVDGRVRGEVLGLDAGVPRRRVQRPALRRQRPLPRRRSMRQGKLRRDAARKALVPST